MRKNWLTLVLMYSSIILLIALQTVWLQSVYKNVKRDLRRETSMLFTTTVMTLQDSILEKNIKPLPGDTTAEFFGSIPSLRDTFRLDHDKATEHRRHPDDIRVFFSAGEPGDSLRKFYRPLLSKIRTNRRQRTFVMRLTMDSLKPEAITRKYQGALAKAEIPLSFFIEHFQGTEHAHESSAGFSTDPFPFSPRNSFYSAKFPDTRLFIVKKLAPQLLFSLFLTLLTVASFFLMYRSIRSNQRLIDIKNDFISNMTHELKTPIATVSVAIEALKNFNGLNDPGRTAEYLDIAQQELNRLSILTDKILKTSIFEDQGIKVQYELVDMEKIITQVLGSFKLVFEKSNAVVKFEKKGTDFSLRGSADHLTNVLYNLIDNAVKYNKEKPEITVLVEDLNDGISFSVQDKGLGIPVEYQTRIFEKFFRVPTGDVVNAKGYGLGLSYVDSVVRQHRGTIKVESSVSEGSTFIITLPKNIA